jgi:hypothetical protein
MLQNRPVVFGGKHEHASIEYPVHVIRQSILFIILPGTVIDDSFTVAP